MKYYIQTLGCAMNYSDSERVAAVLEKMGYKRSAAPEETDLYIFNTCSIRQKGEDRVYGTYKNVAEWKKRNPRLLIGITGCMVRQTSSRNTEENKDELLKKLRELDFVFRITDTHRLPEVMEEAEPNLKLVPMEGADEESGLAAGAGVSASVLATAPAATTGEATEKKSAPTDYLRVQPKYSSPFQAFVPIQIGCDKYCTYCIVPYSRGREKSRPFAEIVAECRSLAENGCREITLVGQTVNSYGKSILDRQGGEFAHMEDPFVELLTQLDKLQEIGLNRLRFTSPHPRDYTDALINAHATLQTLTPHFHLPIQAGDDDVLKRMNRQYTLEHYKGLIDKIHARLPLASVTTDIIVGFCGETNKQFERTAQAFRDIRWDMAFLARYSPRRGTTSVRAWQDDIPREEKARRWHILNKILEECSLEYNQKLVARPLEVLVEKFHEETGECEGKSRENKVVQFQGTPDMVGKIVQVRATKAMKWLVKGELDLTQRQ